MPFLCAQGAEFLGAVVGGRELPHGVGGMQDHVGRAFGPGLVSPFVVLRLRQVREGFAALCHVRDSDAGGLARAADGFHHRGKPLIRIRVADADLGAVERGGTRNVHVQVRRRDILDARSQRVGVLQHVQRRDRHFNSGGVARSLCDGTRVHALGKRLAVLGDRPHADLRKRQRLSQLADLGVNAEPVAFGVDVVPCRGGLAQIADAQRLVRRQLSGVCGPGPDNHF